MPGADVIVIGGGIHGCSTALQLARRGAAVLVLEKDHVGRHASGANAGGVRQLGRNFAEVPLSTASMELWHRIGDLVGDDCGFESHGQVKVAETEGDLEVLRRRVSDLHLRGYDHEELIGRDDLRALVPAVAPHCLGGVLSRADGAALPFQTTMAFKRAAEREGVRFFEGVAVTDIARRGSGWAIRAGGTVHEVDVLVNTAGAWADRIAAALGEPVPLQVIAPMLMITERVPPFLLPVVGVCSRPLSFKQMSNGTVLIGGGHRGVPDRDANETTLDFAELAKNARTASSVFPIIANAQIVRAWAGIEARMPDDIPVIGPSSTEDGVFHAFGFSAHGFQLGPIVGSILAELVITKATNLPIEPFRITRFAERPYRVETHG